MQYRVILDFVVQSLILLEPRVNHHIIINEPKV